MHLKGIILGAVTIRAKGQLGGWWGFSKMNIIVNEYSTYVGYDAGYIDV